MNKWGWPGIAGCSFTSISEIVRGRNKLLFGFGYTKSSSSASGGGETGLESGFNDYISGESILRREWLSRGSESRSRLRRDSIRVIPPRATVWLILSGWKELLERSKVMGLPLNIFGVFSLRLF